MTHPFSEPDADATARVSATVKWYDPAKGFGFLVPGDGAPDIYCRRRALAAVGLDTLLAGAAVVCETVTGERGPEVLRILSIDFSTAPPAPASFATAQGNGRMVAVSHSVLPGPPASGRAIRGIVKWFMPSKGYGFVEPADGSGDVFCHLTAVQASGHDTLPRGAVVTCETVPGDRGLQVSRILSVESPDAEPGPAPRARPFDDRYPDPRPGALPPAETMVPGTVKFFDPARGFGFVVPDAGGREVFVHARVLFRSGMTDLQPGQRVFVRAETAPRGLQATAIEAA